VTRRFGIFAVGETPDRMTLLRRTSPVMLSGEKLL
jgi:hypothetical protein